MQKDKDKWSPNHLLWKKWTHSLIKQSISHSGVSCTSMAIEIKWCPSWSPLYLQILTMTLCFITTPVGQLMTFIPTISYVKSITITSTTKTCSSRVMYRSIHNETLDIKMYHHFFHTTCPLSRTKPYMMSLMASCLVFFAFLINNVLNACQMHPLFTFTCGKTICRGLNQTKTKM
jgi:hypothetical protein